jgi:hypothetical protein
MATSGSSPRLTTSHPLSSSAKSKWVLLWQPVVLLSLDAFHTQQRRPTLKRKEAPKGGRTETEDAKRSWTRSAQLWTCGSLDHSIGAAGNKQAHKAMCHFLLCLNPFFEYRFVREF